MIERDTVVLGDNKKLLDELPKNSVDSIVTDPPYGISFMNKKWDYDIPSTLLWKRCYKVLKPGGHMLVACGTRTQHRMAVNIENAGFEIRDLIAWVYGSGFPKSYDIAKGIEGKLTNGSGNTTAFHHLDGDDIEGNLGFTKSAYTQGARPNDYTNRHKSKKNINFTTEQARQWQGWGTALKPAMELWTLARKPLEEDTIAENVMKYGTGGINIDDCRIGDEEIGGGTMPDMNQKHGEQGVYNGSKVNADRKEYDTHKGRFPANFIHDGSKEVVKHFPKTSPTKPHKGDGKSLDTQNMGWGFKRMSSSLKDNGGSAARFFYCPKASKAEKNSGLENFENIHPSEVTGREIGSAGAQNGGYAGMTETPRKNIHPTVKPLELMRYLVRLITPKDGLVLDPYLGSGTTAIAAKKEKMHYIGFELEKEYCKIAKTRIKAAIVEYDIFDFLSEEESS